MAVHFCKKLNKHANKKRLAHNFFNFQMILKRLNDINVSEGWLF